MAPIKKRTTARAKSARVARPTATLPTPSSFDDDSSFPSSKKDKQKIKHSSFVSKIEKSSSKSSKRRRPNKKLVANLESLADALDDVGTEGAVETGQAKIQRKSLKSRPGAQKRKEKLEKIEKERFNQNLVQLASSTSNGGSVQDRWAALKNHVKNTMEVSSEFTKAQSAT